MSDDHNPSRDDPTPNKSAMDPTAEGARARAQGTPREACPYAQDSEEFHEWVEGYDGMSVEGFASGPRGEKLMRFLGPEPDAHAQVLGSQFGWGSERL